MLIQRIFQNASLAFAVLLGTGCAADESELEQDEFENAAIFVGPTACNYQGSSMSSSDSAAGTVTSSGDYSATYAGWKAFDFNNSTFWISNQYAQTAWIAYEFKDRPRVIQHYNLGFNNGPSLVSRAPRDFTLEGWNGSSWVVVDRQTAQHSWLGTQQRDYDVASPGAYWKYRLHVTDDNDSFPGVHVISLDRIGLYECAELNPRLASTLTVTNEWATGYCADVKITNTTSGTLNGWTVALDSKQSSIYESWSSVRSGSAPTYALKSEGWNSAIAPGASQTIGFCATKTGASFQATVRTVTNP